MITYGKAIKQAARTHAPQFIHRLVVLGWAGGKLHTPFADCASNLDGLTDETLTVANVTCPKCLAKLAKITGSN